MGMLKELGYENPQMKFHYKKPTSNLDKGLESLRANIDVSDMLNFVHKFKLIKVFVEYPVDTSVIDIDDQEDSDNIRNANESDGLGSGNAGLGRHESEDIRNDNVDDVNVGLGNDNEDEFDPLFSYQDTNHDNIDDVNIGNDNVDDVNVGSGNDNVDIKGSDNSEDHDDSEDSEENNFECDLKDQITNVHVHMEMFKEHTVPNVEWVGPTDETFANKELIKGTMTRISVGQMRQLYFTRNDNERDMAKCRGVVPMFSNSGPSGASGSNNVALSDDSSRSQCWPHRQTSYRYLQGQESEYDWHSSVPERRLATSQGDCS
nr:transposase, MuDR [Tanacetum cinerariifolium]